MSSPQESGAYVLSYRDVASFLSRANLGELITQLASEIESVYLDSEVSPVKRVGWPSAPSDALEIMGCQASDFTCVKLISSIAALNGSPTVTGTLICNERGTDRARLVCDAAFLTPMRTATTTAVILRRIAPSARSLGIVGAGLEGIAHAIALTSMVPSIERIQLLDIDQTQAARAAQEISYLLDRDGLAKGHAIQIELCDKESNLYDADVIVTATFAEDHSDVLTETEKIPEGTFIAAVGADLTDKRELPDQLYARAKFIADDLQQCLEDGELQYAKASIASSEEEASIKDHRGSLDGGRILGAANFLANSEPFLARKEEVTIYDSAGFSGQDLAVARVIMDRLDRSEEKRKFWNPPGSRSLVELLGCALALQQSDGLLEQLPSGLVVQPRES